MIEFYSIMVLVRTILTVRVTVLSPGIRVLLVKVTVGNSLSN
jgi:hypothetical protein